MTSDLFWKIVGSFDWSQTGDDNAVMQPALDALAALPEAEIYAFDDALAERLFALDTRAHCRAGYQGESDPDNGDDYISADDFLYLRCAVVANGRKLYDKVLRDPTQMLRGLEFESLLGLAEEAYEAKTGEEYDHVANVSWESFSNREGWRPTKETRPGRATGENVPPGNRRPT